MLKLFAYIFMLPFYIMIFVIKAMFWIPLCLLGLIFDDGPGPRPPRQENAFYNKRSERYVWI